MSEVDDIVGIVGKNLDVVGTGARKSLCPAEGEAGPWMNKK